MYNFDQQTYYIVNYNTIDDLVNKHFTLIVNDSNPGYECITFEEMYNGFMKCYSINGIADVMFAKHDMPKIAQALLSRKAQDLPNLQAILNYLCIRGEIPAGDYLIDVSW